MGPYHGVPRAPWVWQNPTRDFSPFSSKIRLTILPKLPNLLQGHLVRPQNPSAGVPAGNQLLGCVPQCPKTPHNHYGNLPWGPRAPRVRQNPTCKIFTVFQAKFAPQNCPNCCGNVLRGPKNWSVGVPAQEKVIKSLL